MAESAFGIDHGDFSKADTQPKASAGRYAAGTAFGAYHSAFAGKKGKKVGAVGSSLGHSIGGAALGGALGAVTHKPALAGIGGYAGNAMAVRSNQAKGRYKPEV